MPAPQITQRNKTAQFKAMFATANGRMTLFEQKKEQMLNTLAELRTLIYVWEDHQVNAIDGMTLADFTVPLQDYSEAVIEAENKALLDPGVAYVELATHLEAVKEHKGALLRCLEQANVREEVHLTVLKVDIARSLADLIQSDLQFVDLRLYTMEIKVAFTVPMQLQLEFERDILEYQGMREAVTDAYHNLLVEKAEKIKEYDNWLVEHKDNMHLTRVQDQQLQWMAKILDVLTGAKEEAHERVLSAAQRAVDAWKNKKAVYARYKRGIKIRMAVNMISIAASAASIGISVVTTPFGGIAGLVMSGWSLMTNTVQLLELVKIEHTDADTQFQTAQDKISALMARFDEVVHHIHQARVTGDAVSGPKATTTAQEVGIELFYSLTGTKGGMGVAGASEALNHSLKKWIGVEIQIHKAAANIPFMLDYVETLNSACQAWEEQHGPEYQSMKDLLVEIEYDQRFEAISEEIDTLLQTTEEATQKVSGALAWCVDAKKELGDLQEIVVSRNVVKGASYTFKALKVIAATTVDGLEADLVQAVEVAEVAIDGVRRVVGEVDKDLGSRMIKA